MIRTLLFFVLIFTMQDMLAKSNDSLQVGSLDSSSTHTASVKLGPQNLLDSMAEPNTLRHYFFLNEQITKIIEPGSNIEQSRDLPLLKAIHVRNKPREAWKFWTILFNLLFLAIIRLIHIKRFDEIISSAFDLQADFSQYADKAGTYVASHTGLFFNFIIATSFFISSLLAQNHQLDTSNYYSFFLKLSLGIFILYIIKIFINLFIGYLFKIKQMSSVIIFNALVLNNVLGVALVFLNLFYVFVNDTEIVNIIASVSIVTILLSVIYRQVKNILMISQVSKFQFVYILLYLCTLEILPWLVIFKVFLNSW
ncbi:MAG: DUF4271 domain-containing protein [Bacteroidia bacterium]|nr:DUF4271 domain-containing protein [Bacteroidia bacterium]